jgi:hypothetical protein
MSYQQLVAIVIGAIVWLGVLLYIWHQPMASAADRDMDFSVWKAREGKPFATFAEFQGSEQAPRVYLSRWEQAAVATALAGMALFGAMKEWGFV